MKLKEGSLFSGYHGLGMGVSSVLGAEPVWFSEFDKGPSKILAHRFPGVPNHGDITKIDWSQVEPVDILTGGSPCQDLSHAGARKGMTEGTRSNLWVAMREAIAQLKPGLVVWENVGGAFSANASSEVEPCAGCVGDGSGVHLRALGRVLGDLASLGFDAQWTALRAADVGAPHGRLRVFVTAYPAGSGGREGCGITDGFTSDRGRASAIPDHRGSGALLPTPGAIDGGGGPKRIRSDGRTEADHGPALRDVAVALLPTPAVNDMGASYTPDEWDAWTDRMKAEHGNGNGHGKSLHIEAARLSTDGATDGLLGRTLNGGRADDLAGGRLLPTPRAGDGEKGGPNQAGSSGDLMLPSAVQPERWGQYAAAIQRWESLTRPAPAPTELGPRGNPRLSAAFSEWMMGLPAGWVTDVPGITRNEALKALGNGVVPQQAAAALRSMLASEVAA